MHQTTSVLALVGTLVHRERFFKNGLSFVTPWLLVFSTARGVIWGVFTPTPSAHVKYGLCTRLTDQWCSKDVKATLLYVLKGLVHAALVLGSLLAFKS